MNTTSRQPGAWRDLLERLSPRQRQYLLLASILGTGLTLLWLVFAFADSQSGLSPSRTGGAASTTTTNIGVMPAGAQVNPVDQWVGTAGRKLAQYESERDEQARLNKERQSFEARTLQRFAELEQRLNTPSQPPSVSASNPPRQVILPAPAPPAAPMPPMAALPPLQPPAPAPDARPTWPSNGPSNAPSTGPRDGSAQALASGLAAPAAPPAIVRVTVTERAKAAPAAGSASGNGSGSPATPQVDAPGRNSTATFLPVSFTRGILLGGLDAPTGGQAQSNPQPVLIRLADNSVLPNQFRGRYRDCFVIAAGYGDISAERAYLRTESLSCVRSDGATLEVRIQGSVYGEDGKVGMRGRLVTKQGQMLANALLAGVVSGIGQGIGNASTEYSTSALGTVANAQGANAYRAGIGGGVGRALDRLAQYYIKLAENTFPVIEVDAGRQIDVVITRGVRIDTPMEIGAHTGSGADIRTNNRDSRKPATPANQTLEDLDDDNED